MDPTTTLVTAEKRLKIADFVGFDVKAVIYNVKPGLTGIGSIVFRDKEKLLSGTKMQLSEYYRRHIAPYKGELEL